MTEPQNDPPLSGPEFYRRARRGRIRVGDSFLTYEARDGSAHVKSLIKPGEWMLEAEYLRPSGIRDAGMVALEEFERVFGFSPREGGSYSARTRDGETIQLFITRIRRTTRTEATHTLHGGKAKGWGTDEWRAACKEADESVDPLDAKAFGTGKPEDPFFLSLGLPDPLVTDSPSLSTLAKRRREDANRRAFGHPKDRAKTFRPRSLDKELAGGASLGDLLGSGGKDPASAALDAIEARRVRDALDAFGRERPANAAAVERLREGLSRKEAAKRHPPATPKAVEKAEEKLQALVARVVKRAS